MINWISSFHLCRFPVAYFTSADQWINEITIQPTIYGFGWIYNVTTSIINVQFFTLHKKMNIIYQMKVSDIKTIIFADTGRRGRNKSCYLIPCVRVQGKHALEFFHVAHFPLHPSSLHLQIYIRLKCAGGIRFAPYVVHLPRDTLFLQPRNMQWWWALPVFSLQRKHAPQTESTRSARTHSHTLIRALTYWHGKLAPAPYLSFSSCLPHKYLSWQFSWYAQPLARLKF